MSRSDHYRLPGDLTRLAARRSFSVSVCACMLLAGSCCNAIADRPPLVDHSTEIHFPPIGQQEIGDCTCWSSCYYYCTYVQARDEGLDASGGDPNVICSPRFMFALIAQCWWGAECTEYAMSRLSDIGCAPAALHPMSLPYTQWPTEAAWVAALRNRMGTFYKVRADTEEGLETVKQHIADGGCAVTRADFLSNYGDYGASAAGPGINNKVMYRREGYHYLRHSICICGYDDERSYVDDRDGQTYEGAFLIANSEGDEWGWRNTASGGRGFIWIAYNMFLEGEMGWYDYDLDTSPCFDNAPYPEVYYHDDRPQYRPQLYAVAGLNHVARNQLTYSGGVGPTEAPLFLGPEPIQPTNAGIYSISANKRVAVDLTDGISLIPPGATENVFVSLAVESHAPSPATIENVDFYCDFDGDEVYTVVPGEASSPVPVPPGTTGYVSASITNDSAVPGDLDGDGDVDLADLAALLGIYGDCDGDPGYDPIADLDASGCIDLADLAALLGNYGD